MDIKNIKALAEILTKSGLTSLEVCEGDFKVKLCKECEQTVVAAPAPVMQMPVAMAAPPAAEVPDVFVTEHDSNLKDIKSPMVGVFYAAPSPDSAPFVTIGSKVKKGDVLCIIEAMKLMNEILAEVDGEIADICIRTGEIAEFGQVLFKIL